MQSILFLFVFFFASWLQAAYPKSVLTLRAEPEYFSPNKDGIQDLAFLYPVLQSETEAKTWRMDIRNQKGKRIVRMSGVGLPSLLQWDGLDKQNVALPDGVYTAELRVTGSKIKLRTKTEIYLDNTPPQTELVLSTAVLDNTQLRSESLSMIPTIVDSAPLDRWQVQIIDTEGRTVHVYWSTTTPTSVTWDGKDSSTGVLAPSGSYQCALTAWDIAGNESPPTFAEISTKISIRQLLEQDVANINILSSMDGLFVQFLKESLFEMEEPGPGITESGEKLLRELGILINTFPEATVYIEGFSKTNNGRAWDTDRASYYGWNVYSYLVKVAHVKSSRMSVKGRGRAGLEARRDSSIPLVQNGVEVFLAGVKDW